MDLNTINLTEFFEGFDLGTVTCPSIDLPEAAIDHFQVRDSFDEVIVIHQEAQSYLKRMQIEKGNRKGYKTI